eukprot:GHVL01042723.1.p2 GENE.GHVL01042723.1~~GHVL01042723.1.p2  ORF type:complete len:167 (-),score=30.18 GHVL01042723.1:636-1136(-)
MMSWGKETVVRNLISSETNINGENKFQRRKVKSKEVRGFRGWAQFGRYFATNPTVGGWGKAPPPTPPFSSANVYRRESGGVGGFDGSSHFESCEVTPRRKQDGIYFLEKKDTTRKHGCGSSQMGPPQTPSREEELVSTFNAPKESGKQKLYQLASTAPTTELRLKH